MTSKKLDPDRVIYFRAILNLSQQQLADKAGVNIKTVSALELGGEKARKSTIFKVANALGVDAKELFEGAAA